MTACCTTCYLTLRCAGGREKGGGEGGRERVKGKEEHKKSRRWHIPLPPTPSQIAQSRSFRGLKAPKSHNLGPFEIVVGMAEIAVGMGKVAVGMGKKAVGA
eukprot:2695115-Rhodomonas_salina.1